MSFTSVSEIFAKMPEGFNPDAAAGLDAVFQYKIEGDEAGDWFVAIKDQACAVSEGVHDSPSVTLTMGDKDYIALCNGELDGMAAFMSGKLKVGGDIMLAQRLTQLFPPA